MTAAEIAASLQLTEHGRGLAEIARHIQHRTTAHMLAASVALPLDWRASSVADRLRRCPSIVAQPIALATPDGRRLVALQVTHGADVIATIQIPARHLEDEPTPRELAKTIAGLLA